MLCAISLRVYMHHTKSVNEAVEMTSPMPFVFLPFLRICKVANGPVPLMIESTCPTRMSTSKGQFSRMPKTIHWVLPTGRRTDSMRCSARNTHARRVREDSSRSAGDTMRRTLEKLILYRLFSLSGSGRMNAPRTDKIKTGWMQGFEVSEPGLMTMNTVLLYEMDRVGEALSIGEPIS